MQDKIDLPKEKEMALVFIIIGALIGICLTIAYMQMNPPKFMPQDQIADNIELFMNNATKLPFMISKNMGIGMAVGYYNMYYDQSRPLLESIAYDVCTKNMTQIMQKEDYYQFFEFGKGKK